MLLSDDETQRLQTDLEKLGWRIISWGADSHDVYEYTINRPENDTERFLTVFLVETESGIEFAIEHVLEQEDVAERSILESGTLPTIDGLRLRDLIYRAIDGPNEHLAIYESKIDSAYAAQLPLEQAYGQRASASRVHGPRQSKGVVVSGFAASTCLGDDPESLWKELLHQQSGIRKLEEDFVGAYDIPARIGGPLLSSIYDNATRLDIRRMSKVELLASRLSSLAWESCGQPEMDNRRLAVCVGTSFGGFDKWTEAVNGLNQRGARGVSPLTVQMTAAYGAATVSSLVLQAQGSALTRASGAEAIADAWRLIVAGEADVVIAGGLDFAIDPVIMSAFSNIRVLSTNNDEPAAACRPFDKNRDGLVLSDGGAFLVLESEEHARSRGAPRHGRLMGAAGTSEAYHVLAPAPDGEGLQRAMTSAMREAGLSRADVAHITASAPGIQITDAAEAAAIRGANLDYVSVYAPKSAIGHSLAGAGAIEALITVLTLRDRIIPATLNYWEPDPEIDLDIVAGEPRSFQGEFALCNSVQFGGQNTCIVFGQY